MMVPRAIVRQVVEAGWRQRMALPFVLVVIGVVSAVITSFASAVQAAEQNLPPSITVTGMGKVSGRPDTAAINVGVTSRAGTAKEALAANSTSMTSLVAVVKQHGVADKDVQTSNFSVNPTYTSDSSGRNSHISGYQVSNQVRLRVRNLAGMGELLDAIVQNGANTIDGISFYIENADQLLDKARAQSVEDAHRKAVLYASAAGVKLGRVLYMNESGGYLPAPHMPVAFNARMTAMASSIPPMESGEEEVQSTVTVVYAIE
jgi:uncharacterized protein